MRYLQPWKEKKEIHGRISYNESAQAWSILRLHKTIIEEFKELKDKKGVFDYEMVLFYSYDQLEGFMKNIKAQGKAPPLLLWIGRRN